MAYPHKIMKLTFGGSLFTNEIWSNGLHIGRPDGDAFPQALVNYTELCDALAAAVEVYQAKPRNIGTQAHLEWVKLAFINEDGKYGDNDAIYHETVPPIAGAGTGLEGVPVPQNTLVYTLKTAVTRGLAKTGRIYPPINVSNPDGTAHVNATDVGYKLTAIKDLVNDINAVLTVRGTGCKVIVASKERTGAIRDVTEVSVGNVIDTQRSRRNNLVEAYVEAEIDLT